MATYERKPPIVKAFQWNGTLDKENQSILKESVSPIHYEKYFENLLIHFGEGETTLVKLGEWVVMESGMLRIMANREFTNNFKEKK